jgi:hypothetical protein
MSEVLQTTRKRFTTRRLLGMVALFAISFALITTFHTGRWPIFLLGTAGTSTFFGAALGVPFDRTAWGAMVGAALGLAFFGFAVAT